MLLEFKVSNYKSFCEEASFQMTAAPKQKGLDYSLLKARYKRTILKGLCSSVIYGPNASGKTNIVGAMDTFRAIVLRGNIRNPEESNTPNSAAAMLELIPNNKLEEPKPVEFYIDFYEDKKRVQYALKLDLGTFMDVGYERRILNETLMVNGETVFERGSDIHVNAEALPAKEDLILESSDTLTRVARTTLNKDELFLTNGFRLLYSKRIAEFIVDWMTNKLMVIYRADAITLIRRFADPQKKSVYIDKTTDEAASIFGINSNGIAYVTGEDDTEPKLSSLITVPHDKRKIAMPAEMFESYGTTRFVNLFPLVIRALQTGSTLIVDEFDASIHPMAVMNIINIFHNDDINIHQAQLIINTHNPIFLNSNLLRRDEIKFVERDAETHFSSLYALSDFGTSGENGVRQHDDYMKNYFIDQYGAISDIDFSPLFASLVAEESEE